MNQLIDGLHGIVVASNREVAGFSCRDTPAEEKTMQIARTIWCAGTLCSLLLGGCTVPGDGGSSVTGARSEASDQLTGIMAYHWASSEPEDVAAMRLPLQFAQPSLCRFSFALDAVINRSVPVSMLVAERDEEFEFWAAQEFGAVAVVNAPVIERRELFFGESRISYSIEVSGLFSGRYTLTHMVNRATAAAAADGFVPGFARAVSLSCDQPFDIVGAQRSADGALLGVYSLEGIGANAGTFGGASVMAAAQVETQSEDSRFYMFPSSPSQLGQADLQHPDGSQSWTLAPPGQVFYQLRSGAGAYDLSLTRAAAGAGWMMAVFGYEPMDLADGKREQTAIAGR